MVPVLLPVKSPRTEKVAIEELKYMSVLQVPFEKVPLAETPFVMLT
jgi:hypothetical protein